MNEIRARELFDVYPDSDLMPLPDPLPNETISTYLSWIPEADSDYGDTLFRFLILELHGCQRAEARRRMRVAMDDLQCVLNSLEREP
jgi:hypothetical protein